MNNFDAGSFIVGAVFVLWTLFWYQLGKSHAAPDEVEGEDNASK